MMTWGKDQDKILAKYNSELEEYYELEKKKQSISLKQQYIIQELSILESEIKDSAYPEEEE